MPPTDDYGGAECLYMIIMAAQNEEADDRSIIKPENIGDFDNDGFPEIVDAWGMPIRFLRWAPGFTSDLQVIMSGSVTGSVSGTTATMTVVSPRLSSSAGSYLGGAMYALDPATDQLVGDQSGKISGYAYSGGTGTFTFTKPSYTTQAVFKGTAPTRFALMPPDPFDPRGTYPLYPNGAAFSPGQSDTSAATFALYPLIFSAGPDKNYGVAVDFSPALEYSNVRCNPFAFDGTGVMIGTQKQLSVETSNNAWIDNIHNHMITSR
jgi:hypothetical protein